LGLGGWNTFSPLFLGENMELKMYQCNCKELRELLEQVFSEYKKACESKGENEKASILIGKAIEHSDLGVDVARALGKKTKDLL
tara:strand:+ start:602 stop:853 length:252 start_codon:yes stop_codon:yes gene_type:complete